MTGSKVRVKTHKRLTQKEYNATVYWRPGWRPGGYPETPDRWGVIIAKSQAEVRKIVRREYSKKEHRQIRKIKVTKGREV